MNQLKHPTLAEQAVAEFKSATKTVSLVAICNRMRADRFDRYSRDFRRRIIEYVFDDDSSLQISGQGKTHHVETFLP